MLSLNNISILGSLLQIKIDKSS